MQIKMKQKVEHTNYTLLSSYCLGQLDNKRRVKNCPNSEEEQKNTTGDVRWWKIGTTITNQ